MLRSSNNPFTATPRPLLWVSVILASLALRIPGLTESLWFDEVFRTRVILSGESARSVLLYDVHNPLYNAFMFLWIRLFGDSEISIRIPSLIAGYALTLLLYRWARDRFSPLIAQLAAAWLLLAPVPVWYSTEAKNTIFTALLAVLCVTSSDALATAPRSRRAITRAIVTTLLAIACDFQLLLIILPCWLTLLLESRRTPALPRALSITAANSVVLAAPWAVFKLLHLPSLARDYLGLFHLKQLLWFLCIWLPLGGVVGAPGPNQWPLYVALPALILLPLLAVALREAAATQQGRLVRAAFLLPILFFIAASFLLHAVGDRTRIYQDRNLAVIIPFFPLLLAVGISALTRPRIRRALSALLVGSALVSSILMLTARAETWTVMAPNPDWRGAAKLIPADTPVSPPARSSPFATTPRATPSLSSPAPANPSPRSSPTSAHPFPAPPPSPSSTTPTGTPSAQTPSPRSTPATPCSRAPTSAPSRLRSAPTPGAKNAPSPAPHPHPPAPRFLASPTLRHEIRSPRMTATAASPSSSAKDTSSPYAELCKALYDVATLSAVNQLLNWDQETYMPAAAAGNRAEQQATLAALVHERKTSPRIGELLAACESDSALTKSGSESAANLREIRRDYDLATKLPADLVADLARTGSQAQEAWKHAREKSDFAAFAPWLDKMMTLTRRKAECYRGNAKTELYDALLDEYEPGMTAAEIEKIFTPLRASLTELIAKVQDSGTKVNTKVLNIPCDERDQHALGQIVLKAIGFDLDAGRLDVTTHPFCSGFAPGDTRLTTRYRGEKFTDALYGTLHEAGHGIYEQGLPKLGKNKFGPLFGQPLAEAISLGIHESQSRMWENFVGRSKPFWKWAHPLITKHLSKKFDKYTPKDLYLATNTTQPSLIRVEADEGTYNMHVMIRFEIERALIAGDMAIKDVPAEWNKRYKDYLGIDVPDDRRGCLQDVHWSFGLIGYFPTYTLGNLYAAQLWDTINEQIPDLQKQIAKGKFLELKEWLNTNIHRHGRRYLASDLCKKVTGKELSAEPLLRHLTEKAEAVYGI